MPFIALVYVDDHTAKAIQDGEINVGGWGGVSRFVGLFIWPERKDIGCTGHSGWTRDKLGFMKCGTCGKRNKCIRRFFINSLFDHLGANHYSKAPAAFRTHEDYGPVRGQ